MYKAREAETALEQHIYYGRVMAWDGSHASTRPSFKAVVTSSLWLVDKREGRQVHVAQHELLTNCERSLGVGLQLDPVNESTVGRTKVLDLKSAANHLEASMRARDSHDGDSDVCGRLAADHDCTLRF